MSHEYSDCHACPYWYAIITQPDLDDIREGSVIDTEVVILLDLNTQAIGYLDIRCHMQAKGEDGRVFGNFRKVTVITINDDCAETFFETQEEANRAALAAERAYAEEILRKCEEFERSWLAK